MWIKNLELKNFRNYQEAEISFSKDTNIFIGENAQGKTNLMEAIYFLALARSHRTNKDKEIIHFGEDFAYVKGQIQGRYSDIPLEISLSSKGKSAKVNHLLQPSLSQYIGQLKVVLFAPEDLTLVKGAPSGRRRFIDMELGQMSPIYLQHLSSYQAILKQRNSYLKQLKYSRNAEDLIFLDVLTEQLAGEAAEVVARRIQFIDHLKVYAQDLHLAISQNREELDLAYSTSLSLETYPQVDKLKEEIHQQFLSMKDRELDQGTTLLGPHRDDLLFYVNGKNVHDFGSQGQQRTTVLSLKLAEIDLIKEVTGDYPVLLLDDVLSELDDGRQTHLLKVIENKVQTFLTTTSIDGVNLEQIHHPNIYWIRDGQIEMETK